VVLPAADGPRRRTVVILIARRVRAALTGKIYFFNGQKNSARVFHALNRDVPFENYVETGTFLGMTTDFLARTARERGARVYSCEIDDRHFAIASRTVGMLHARAGIEYSPTSMRTAGGSGQRRDVTFP
jgi:predicted O-methyltransferase YrrM